ncbi:MAG: ComF family protein [Paracoccus sp. (in: a-proteobacteria)]|uniref:ComF family protein n=1 Tax=Paracoccus sp. TaxID=267 RepID=UPI0026DF04E5|nr:ComF family protein [Paracoccus sp. (in: a-proteobacteria)]MDO5630812.1 ComF family protein [Paracoccus sp. (in: a-proteobacteria)]
MGLQHNGLRSVMKGALRLLYPPQCLGCGDGVSEDGGLCPDCWRETRFITGTCCTRCGAPLPDDGTGIADLAICDECLRTPRPWRAGRAAMVYTGTGRGIVLALKHGDRADLAPALAGWLSRAAAPLIRPGMIVAPVPIHWRRLLKRKYNQAELLSAGLARLRGLDHIPDLLTRPRHTEGQDHKGVSDRFANIAGSLTVPHRRARTVQGRAVLLVDDVMTSGATLTEAANALIDAGSGPVSVVTLARAVKQD